MQKTGKRIPEGFPNERLVVLPRQSVRKLKSNPIACQLYPCRLGFFPRAHGHYISRAKGLDEHVVILCLEGKGYVRTGNGDVQTLQSSQVALLPAHEAHHYEADAQTPWTIAWFHFKGLASAYYVQTIMAGNPSAVIRMPVMEQLVRQFEALYKLTQSVWYDASVASLHASLAILLSTIAEYREQTNKQVKRRNDRLEQVLDFLSQNVHRVVSVEEMAKVAHWTPNHMSMLFRKEMNMSPAACFMHMKMARACERLRSSDASIGAIADSLGFEDPYYFSRCFSRCYQMSPSEYRKTG